MHNLRKILFEIQLTIGVPEHINYFADTGVIKSASKGDIRVKGNNFVYTGRIS